MISKSAICLFVIFLIGFTCANESSLSQVLGLWRKNGNTAAYRTRREVPVAADLRNTPCAPNDYFKIDCNTCYCNLERTGYLCTENFCTGGAVIDSEIRLSNDTKVIITNGDVKLVKDNVTTFIDNNLNRIGKVMEAPSNDTTPKPNQIIDKSTAPSVVSQVATSEKIDLEVKNTTSLDIPSINVTQISSNSTTL